MSSDENLDQRFKVQGPLRCTGVGSLMCAEDRDGARAAIRMVPQQAQGSEAVAAVLKFPIHPALPRALSSGQINDTAWIALDFPEGVLVSQKWPLELPRLLTMGSAVANGLAALHQGKIVHGELSGDSVLVVPTGADERFVLFDAPLVVINRMTDRRGEERLLAQLTHIVPYLSPERARGLDADFASDIWALGVLLGLAAGARTIPGNSALEKIAAIVAGSWRPAVPGTLPIALRLLLTRMLALEPRARPSALDVAIELSNLLEAMGNQQTVTPHAASVADTHPVSTARVEVLVKQMNQVDPFAALVSKGVSVNSPDVNAEPTRRVMLPDFTDPDAPVVRAAVPGHDVTDPHAQLPVPTAPAPAPSWPPLPRSQLAEAVVLGIPPEGLLVPPVPDRRRTPQPLPPILDPKASLVPPSARQVAPSPLPKVVGAAPEVGSGPMVTTMRYGELPDAPVREALIAPPLPIQLRELPIQLQQVAPRPEPVTGHATDTTVDVVAPPMTEAAVEVVTAPVRSIHDELEDAFDSGLRKARARRWVAAGIAAALLVLGAIALVLKAQPAEDPVPVPVAAQPENAPAPKAVAAETAPMEPVKDAPAAKPEPLEAPTAEPAKAAPVETARAAPPEPAKAAAPVEPRPEAHKAAPGRATTPVPAPAPHRAASRLDEGD